MKPRNVIKGLFYVLAAAGLAGLFYLLGHSTTPKKAAEAVAPAPGKVGAPALSEVGVSKPNMPPPLASPIAPPLTKPVADTARSVAAADSSATAVELDATIKDMVGLMQSGDMASVMEKYRPPEELAQLTPEAKTQMEQQSQYWMTDLGALPFSRALIQGWQSLEDQTPSLNTTGDEATYQMTAPGFTISGGGDVPPRTSTVVFEKTAGHWYIESKIHCSIPVPKLGTFT